MREDMGDYRLGLRPEDVTGVLARAGFTDLRIEKVRDQYVVQGPHAEPIALPLFLVRGRAPNAQIHTHSDSTS